jgi:DNA repair protein RadA/Sms
MSKSSVVFVCRDCGGESIRWGGQCPHCRAWNTLEEFRAARGGREPRGVARASAPARLLPITDVEVDAAPRLILAWDELNRVLGGGVVAGSVVLLGGEPGVGKSTLLMHLAAQAAAARRVIYASGEESAHQVGMRARRLGVATPGLLLLAETDVDLVVGAIERESPAIAIVDSIQTMHDTNVDAAPGTVSQVREAAARLMRAAKESGVPVFLIGHVTKEGAIAGPRVLEHMVDTVLYLEGERGQDFRILRAAKNRFGSTEEIGIFSMSDAGMAEVRDPGVVLLGDLRPVPGTVVLAAMEGSRPLLVELQSLVATAQYASNPRRSANGVDLNRLHMLLAVLENRAKLRLGERDVFVNVAGGIKVIEPAADLGLALSLAGNVFKQAVRPDTVIIGEVGLSGEVRRVGRLERRLQEAARRGFVRAVVARGAVTPPDGMELVEVLDLSEAIDAVFPAHHRAALEMPGGSR